VIDSAPSAETLRKRLKAEQLERYGDQFIPKFVYDAIRKLKRFDTMVVSTPRSNI
jgi:ubiquitin carboxyl-terminal hydrolase 10